MQVSLAWDMALRSSFFGVDDADELSKAMALVFGPTHKGNAKEKAQDRDSLLAGNEDSSSED